MLNPLIRMHPEDLKDFEWHVISGCDMYPETVAHLCRHGFIKWNGVKPKLTNKAYAHFRRLRGSQYWVDLVDGRLTLKYQHWTYGGGAR